MNYDPVPNTDPFANLGRVPNPYLFTNSNQDPIGNPYPDPVANLNPVENPDPVANPNTDR
jgi:hypothetical protein